MNKLVWIAAFALGALVITPQVMKHWQARELLLGLAQRSPDTTSEAPAAQVLQRATLPELVSVHDLTVPVQPRPLAARIYARPDRADGPRIALVHGVHHLGIDEPRLVRFAKQLANAGLVVFTPELEDLARYRITERSVSEVVGSTQYLSAQLSGDTPVGLIGFSFGGGLSLLAGADPELRERLRFVASIGGHHDLSRVLRFFIDDAIDTPSGVVRQAAHEYGLIVLVYECIADLVPEHDVALASRVLEHWLKEERDAGRELMSEATTPQAERLFTALLDGELGVLEPELSAILRAREQHLAKLSPRGRLAELPVPAYLLHGQSDSVIPASETLWADLELGQRRHLALVTPLVRHVELDGEPSLLEQWRLLDFVAHLL